VYEHLTELLFFGRQDAMQRTSLLPLAEYVREAELAGRPPADLRLLEVAAGTGRFHTFIKVQREGRGLKRPHRTRETVSEPSRAERPRWPVNLSQGREGRGLDERDRRWCRAAFAPR
jgi:hypothetical protein